jgi:hypothetical protein
MDEGQVVVLTQDKKGRPKLIYVKGERPGAGIENLVTQLRAILLMGKPEEILRAMAVMQQAFPQPKNGKNGHSSEPIMPNFTRAEGAETPAPGAAATTAGWRGGNRRQGVRRVSLHYRQRHQALAAMNCLFVLNQREPRRAGVARI